MPSRRDDPDLMGAEAIRSVDDQNGAILRQTLRNFEGLQSRRSLSAAFPQPHKTKI
jgi:hypothetical protein